MHFRRCLWAFELFGVNRVTFCVEKMKIVFTLYQTDALASLAMRFYQAYLFMFLFFKFCCYCCGFWVGYFSKWFRNLGDGFRNPNLSFDHSDGLIAYKILYVNNLYVGNDKADFVTITVQGLIISHKHRIGSGFKQMQCCELAWGTSCFLLY